MPVLDVPALVCSALSKYTPSLVPPSIISQRHIPHVRVLYVGRHDASRGETLALATFLTAAWQISMQRSQWEGAKESSLNLLASNCKLQLPSVCQLVNSLELGKSFADAGLAEPRPRQDGG